MPFLSTLTAKLITAGILIAIIGALYRGWQKQSARAELAETNLSIVTGERDQLKHRNEVLEQASIERAQDTAAVENTAKELNDAIKDIPAGSPPSPAAVALGCQRLRQAGTTSSDTFKRVCGGR